jgi:hypothetical protein
MATTDTDKAWRTARRTTGLARFERTTRGYKTPGTIAAGRWEMLRRATEDEYRRLIQRARAKMAGRVLSHLRPTG